jgi:hypothetical protein
MVWISGAGRRLRHRPKVNRPVVDLVDGDDVRVVEGGGRVRFLIGY